MPRPPYPKANAIANRDAVRRASEIPDPTGPVRLRDDTMLTAWRDIALEAQECVTAALRDGEALQAKNYAITAGVATDKALLLAGRPTSISASVHEHRHTLPQLAERLALVARRLDQPVIDAVVVEQVDR